jgi:hypothetical protein
MKSNPTIQTLLRVARYVSALALALAASVFAQSFATTTVQGTVYLASGKPASGTVQISWPAFTTAAGQAVTAGRTSLKLPSDGFLSVALAPNQGSTPAGLYYTVVYNLSDGSANTEYWTIPAAAQAAVAQVRAQVMPASQAVQAVSKTYVDQSIQQIAKTQMSSIGGTLTGPLYLDGDPMFPAQAASKHYVDGQFSQALSRWGGVASGPITATQLGAVFQVDQFSGADFGAQLQACVNQLSGTSGGTCDARNFPGVLTMAGSVSVSTANLTINLPCATITTGASFLVTAGTRNVTLHGCASRGTSAASGSQGGTVFAYSGSGLFFQIGDPAYVIDTLGFHLDNVVVNTTSAPSPSARALAAYRTQEMHLESLYLLGNANQTGITLDGTGNYTGGTFTDVELVGFQTAVNAIGHQVANAATTDWLNASTFVRPHIVCPVSNGNPIAGTTGINLLQGDGNTFTGGDIEGCATALHLGPSAQNNTIIGLRTENSTSQVIADAGSSYNNWVSGGTMFTGKLTDNGTRNSFMDTFHRSFNSLNGDWFGSQQDTTLTNHYRLGIGSGNERGLLNRYQTDYGYRWTTGLSDAAGGAQFYQVQDELNNVYRLSIGQYNPGQPSTNNQTVLNSAGTGAIVLNGSSNAGTGGVVFGAGGASGATVATVDKSGNANFTGTLQIGGTAQSTGTLTVRNNADTEVDYYLWPGLTTSQKGSFTYKDYAGNSQWYMVKDTSNNWALNSAIGGLDSIKAYQSSNSGDTYINASNSSGAVRINYESGAGSAFNIYGGSSSNLYASFTAPNAIKFPGLAAASGKSCVHIDASGYISNTGTDCGQGGNVNPGVLGQIAYYTATGAILAGMSAVPVASGGTGAADPATAIVNLGGVPAAGGTMTGQLNGTSASFSGSVTATQALQAPLVDRGGQVFNVKAFGAKGDGTTDDTAAFIAAWTAAAAVGGTVFCPASATVYIVSTIAITSAMSNTSLIGPVRSLNSAKGCTLKANGTGYIISNAGDNPGTSHPHIDNVHISNVGFSGNFTSFGAIYLDYAFWPIIDHNNFGNFAACATSGGLPVEPCTHIIKTGASLYCNFQNNIFTGNGYAIDAQWAYTSRPLAGSYGCNDIDLTGNIFSSSLGVRVSGDSTVEKNDFEMSLQRPAVAQMDFSDSTVGAVIFYANFGDGNYSESSTFLPDAAHSSFATNVLVRCGTACVGLTVKNNKRLYGNNFLAESKAIWIDNSLYQLDISGNGLWFWESNIYVTPGKGFNSTGGVLGVGSNGYGNQPMPTATQPTLTLTQTGGTLTSIAFAGGTAGAYASYPQVQFTGGNCTVIPTASGVISGGTLTGFAVTRAGSGCDGTLTGTSVGGIPLANVQGTAFTAPVTAVFAVKHTNPGVQWADDTGFHFDGRAVTFTPYSLGSSDTTLDLQLANLYELPAGTLAISAVTNTRPGQKFSIRNRGGALTLANSAFNLCTGADFVIPAGATLQFGVGTNSTVREEGCGSKAISGSGGGGGGGTFFTAHLTGQTSGVGNTTITTVGASRTCYVATSLLHTTVVGTAGTIATAFYSTVDGSTVNMGSSNTINATQVPTNGGSLARNIQYFCADAGTNVQYAITLSGITGSYAYNWDVTLQQVQ